MPARAHPNYLTARPDTFAAGRAIGIKRTRHSLGATKPQCHGSKPEFGADPIHAFNRCGTQIGIQVTGDNLQRKNTVGFFAASDAQNTVCTGGDNHASHKMTLIPSHCPPRLRYSKYAYRWIIHLVRARARQSSELEQRSKPEIGNDCRFICFSPLVSLPASLSCILCCPLMQDE
jgi:hypothetical protein